MPYYNFYLFLAHHNPKTQILRKRMKKILFPILAFATLIFLPTGCSNENSGDEAASEQMYQFAVKFADMASKDMVDSLAAYYPDITVADSITLEFSPENIVITPVDNKGKYKINLNGQASLTAEIDDDGKISVTSSHGLFSFPEDKKRIALKTGMLDDSVSDKEFSNRIKDDEFFKHIDKLISEKKKNIIGVGKYVDTSTPQFYGSGEQTLTNNTDTVIDGSDYVMLIKYEIASVWEESTSYSTRPGETIPSHSSITIELDGAKHSWEEMVGFKMLIPDADVMEKYISFTGNEYRDWVAERKK